MTITPSPVLCVGETMALVTPSSTDRLRTAGAFALDVGGAESNVAAHLAQLGRRSIWFSRLGDDELGRRVSDVLAARGVDLAPVIFDPEAPTGVYFKDPGHGVLYYRRGSAASRLSAADADALDLGDIGLVHLSGITPALSTSAAAFIDQLVVRTAESGIPISFDVNYRSPLWPREDAAAALLRLSRQADVVFVGRDEAELLWGTITAEAVRDLLDDVPTLVIKDGDVGATEFTGEQRVFEPAIPTDVVEVVGAGDAFAAGYLAAMLDGEASAARLTAGHRRAALALQTTTDFLDEGASA
ncbi:sugar kinase [Nesterenkonia sp. PF2B19]|uniref:sugar kinase n=1 Tax=Nesterenkonia sp. PF2B19 TaxID=1881858 RepID=UPI0008724CF6|nr:sugar kinase [Nesterenkonia sp. PF2B19]OSM43250.1 carbohydrate kinase [Nesterenkonia sp. PF2B19]